MIRLTGERKALAAAVFAFYGFLFLLMSLQPPPGWAAVFAGLGIVYGLGFLGLVAGYFWARWYAIGVALSGLISGAMSMFQVGAEPVLVFYAGTHGIAALVLYGHSMAKTFDGQVEWRERFHLDEGATEKLGKLVVKLGVSLPYLVMYSLAPREDMGQAILAAAGLGIAAAGFWAVLRMRTWGVFALAGAATILFSSVMTAPGAAIAISSRYDVNTGALGVTAVSLLLLAIAPLLVRVAERLRD